MFGGAVFGRLQRGSMMLPAELGIAFYLAVVSVALAFTMTYALYRCASLPMSVAFPAEHAPKLQSPWNGFWFRDLWYHLRTWNSWITQYFLGQLRSAADSCGQLL